MKAHDEFGPPPQGDFGHAAAAAADIPVPDYNGMPDFSGVQIALQERVCVRVDGERRGHLLRICSAQEQGVQQVLRNRCLDNPEQQSAIMLRARQQAEQAGQIVARYRGE